MLPISQSTRNYETKILLSFVKGCRNTTITKWTKQKNNPKAMWKTITKVLHKNSHHTVTQNIIFKGTEFKSPLQISEASNKQFTTVGPKLAEKVISQPLDDLLRHLGNEINNAKFKLETVSVGYVERTIRALNKPKSTGADRIPLEVLKDAVHLVLKPLTLIYNESLEKVIFS